MCVSVFGQISDVCLEHGNKNVFFLINANPQQSYQLSRDDKFASTNEVSKEWLRLRRGDSLKQQWAEDFV